MSDNYDNGLVTIIRASSAVLAVSVAVIGTVGMVEIEEFDLSLVQLALMATPGIAGNAAVALLPWPRLVAEGRGRAILRTQVLASAALVLAAIVLAPADRAISALVMSILLVYSALVLRLREHLLVTAFGAVVLAGSALTADTTVSRAIVMATSAVSIAVLSAIGSGAIRRALHRSRESLQTAERTVAAMAAVATSARSLATADASTILDAVSASAASVASGIAGIYVLEPDGEHLRFTSTHGIPDRLQDEQVHRSEGLAGAVLARGETVVVGDYGISPYAVDAYREVGLRAAMGTPIVVLGTLHGVLVAGRFTAGGYRGGEVAALELLAGHAERALELSIQIEHDRATIERLVELERLKEDFLATVSHEMRTPLTVVGGIAETLDAHLTELPDDLLADLVRRLYTSTATMNRIVTDLLDLRVLDDGLQPTRDVLDLAALVVGVVDRLQPLATEHDLEVSAPGTAHCLGDEMLLERVVENLVVNALRHTPAGTRVRADVDVGVDSVGLEVHDDGPGISAEDLPRVRDRFVRGGPLNERQHRGLGLGLSLADEILSLHDATLEVSSEPGAGARFAFRLPRATMSVSA